MILGQTVANIFDFFPAETILRSFAQYLIAFCNRHEVASDVISSVAGERVGMDDMSYKIL